MMKREEEVCFARAQARLFEVLARCFRRPDITLAEEVARAGVSGAFGSVLADGPSGPVASAVGRIAAFERTCAAMPPDDIRLALEIDYNRLFVGPAALLAPPYESFYASEAGGEGFGRLRTEEERAVVAAYRESGFEVPESFTDLPDHIAVELEFLSLLAAREADAWESDAAADALAAQGAQARFVERRLGLWVSRFAERVEAGARTPFYPAAARIAEGFCAR